MAEVELKLELVTSDRDKLLASDLLGKPDETIAQNATYFDTADRKLFGNGFSLRVRRAGDVTTQTVKATGPAASLFARSEWETPLEGTTPALDGSSPFASELDVTSADILPHFTVAVQRDLWNVAENSSKVEVVLDWGDVFAGERRTTISEMELELKDGAPLDLFALARKVEKIVPVRFGVESKAERGYRLIDAARLVVKAEPIELNRRDTAISMFQAIAWSCFRHFRLNEDILLRERNSDALHQARVAIRRLRSAFSLFKPIVKDGNEERLTAEFRWLAQVLGEARNIDVLLTRVEDVDLRDRLLTARSAAYDEAIEALNSFRARALMLDYLQWLYCGDYLSREGPEDDRQKTSESFAAAALDKIRKKLKKHGRDLAGLDDEHRHQARKDAKKVRYAAEFFRSLFSDKRGERRHRYFIAAMDELQERLGTLNDMVTGPDVLDKHGLRDHPQAESLLVHANKHALISKAQSALGDVLDAKRFWR